MNSNQPNPANFEDEIDLRGIVKKLIESKKLIITSILIFTAIAILFSFKTSYKSSVIVEIGYFENAPGESKLIEDPSNLIKNLKIDLLYKSLIKYEEQGFEVEDLIITILEDKLLKFELASSSSVNNNNILTEVINYIVERHSSFAALLSGQNRNQILNEIDLVKSEISYVKRMIRDDIEARISKLKDSLSIIDQEISQLKQIIIENSNNLTLIKDETMLLKERTSDISTLEQIIFSYKSKVTDLEIDRKLKNSETNDLNRKLDDLNNNTFQSRELLELTQAQKNLENILLSLESQSIINTIPIMDIKTETIKPKITLLIFLGVMVGFIIGIFLLLILNFIKSLKES